MASTLPNARPDATSATPRSDLANLTPSPRESNDSSMQQYPTEQKSIPLKPPIHEVLPKEGLFTYHKTGNLSFLLGINDKYYHINISALNFKFSKMF